MAAGDLPEKVLESVEESRRSFLTRLILGTAFVAPAVASFSMSGLGANEALANCSNLLCSNQGTDCSLVGTVTGNFSGCDYAGRNLYGMNLAHDCFMDTDFAGANLSSADLNCAILSGANLAGANLNRAILTSADLAGANLAGANLTFANLSRANLTGANLTGANLHGATLTSVIWSDTTCPDGANSGADGGTCLLNLKTWSARPRPG